MTEPNKLAELAARALSGGAGARDAMRGSVIGSVAGSGLVDTSTTLVKNLSHFLAVTGWVDNKTATNLQMAEAVVDYMGGRIDEKTTVAKFIDATTDRFVFDMMKEGGASNLTAKITSAAVGFIVGKLAGLLLAKVEDGILGKDTTLGKALETLTTQKNGQTVEPPAQTVSGLPPQTADRSGAARAAKPVQ